MRETWINVYERSNLAFHRKRNKLLAEKLIATFFEASESNNDRIPPLIECPAISQVSVG